MRPRSFAWLLVVALSIPALAEAQRGARFDKGRIGATRQQIADALNAMALYPPNVRMSYVKSGVRIRTKVDKAHFQIPHQHVVGHTPRLVKWSYPAVGVTGTAESDTILGGGLGTTVTNVRPDPPPWSTPSQQP